MGESAISSPSSSSASLMGLEDIEKSFSVCSAAAAAPLLRQRPTFGSLSLPAPVTFFLEDLSDGEPHHFLDYCFLCKKPLASNRDIFMYRGDTPFCSDVCRAVQIEMDEATKNNRKAAMKTEANQKKQQQKSSTSPKPRAIHVHAGTVVAG